MATEQGARQQMSSLRFLLLLVAALLASCASESETATQSQPLLTDGLLHHWTLDGDALDSASTQDGTIVGATTAAGQVGDALNFDGSDYVDLGTFADTASTLSVTAWVNQTGWTSGSGDGRIIAVSTSTSEQDHQLMLSAINGQQQCRMKAGGSTFTLKGGTATLGVWQHVACTYDGSRVRLYVDGVEVADRSWSGSVVLSMPGALGRNPSGGRNLNGLVDDVRIYSRALSAAEIGELMAWQPPSELPDASVPPDSGTDAGLDSGADSGADAGPDSGAGGLPGVGGSAGEGGSCWTAGGGSGGATGGTGGEPVGGSGGESTGGTGEPDAGAGGSGGETGGMGGEGGQSVDAGTGGSGECEECEPPPPQYCSDEVTLILSGDFGYPGDNVGSKFAEWLDLVAAMTSLPGRYVLVASGDLAYEETNEHTWFNLFASRLPHVAMVASRGNHENAATWAQYQDRIAQHNLQFPWLTCTGNHGIDALCEVEGVSIVQSDIVQLGWREKMDLLVPRLASVTPGNWLLCSWHETRDDFTVGSKGTTVPEEPYQACQAAGALIVNAHDHAYTRSCTISDILTPANGADCTGDVRVGGGETAVIVSGRGGRNMAAFTGSNAWTGSYITTSASSNNGVSGSGNADPGALFVTFGGSQPADEARAVYLDSKLREMDRFTIRRAAQ